MHGPIREGTVRICTRNGEDLLSKMPKSGWRKNKEKEHEQKSEKGITGTEFLMERAKQKGIGKKPMRKNSKKKEIQFFAK